MSIATDLSAADVYALRGSDPARLGLLLAAYDAAGIRAIIDAYVTEVWARDGIRITHSFVTAAWLKAGLITAAQAMGRLEALARALGDDPVALEARLREAAGCLAEPYRQRLRRARFDAAAKTLTGDGLRLVWKLRARPDAPESYANQQTSIGVVQLEVEVVSL